MLSSWFGGYHDNIKEYMQKQIKAIEKGDSVVLLSFYKASFISLQSYLYSGDIFTYNLYLQSLFTIYTTINLTTSVLR